MSACSHWHLSLFLLALLPPPVLGADFDWANFGLWTGVSVGIVIVVALGIYFYMKRSSSKTHPSPSIIPYKILPTAQVVENV
jgi:Na+-driven multidrug efflux pump